MLQNCSRLSAARLGSGTEYIGDFVFDGTSIKDLYIDANIPPVAGDDSFCDGDSYIFDSCTLHVAKGCRKLYSRHSVWGKFNRIEEQQ